jgi:aryl-alcohol dehydrogenase-like predicted oxidoreductase
LGKTNLQVSELALGGLFTSSLGNGLEETCRILEQAIDLGINYVDTAPAYSDSEQVLGGALRRLGSKARHLIVSTKIGGWPQPFDARNREFLRRSVERSRKLLDREVIDILMMHEPDRPQQYDWWTNPQSCQGPVIELLAQLKDEAIIKHAGVGGTTATEMAHFIRSGHFDVVLTAFNYNALFREAVHEVLPAAQAQGMGIVIASILGQGPLGRRYDEQVRSKPVWLSRPRQQQLLALYSFLDELGMTLPEISLRFVLSNPDISCALIGAKTAFHVETCVAYAEKGTLPADILRRLDEIAAMVPFRPFEEPIILPFNKPYYGPGPANLGMGIPVGKL